MKEAIATNNLKIGYDDFIVVPSFDADFIDGKITSIIGPNGCGKSTVLKALGRILKKKDGQIIINGEDISSLKTKDIAKKNSNSTSKPKCSRFCYLF